MEDQITINLRALTERQRLVIESAIDQSLNDGEDEINIDALETLQQFTEN